VSPSLLAAAAILPALFVAVHDGLQTPCTCTRAMDPSGAAHVIPTAHPTVIVIAEVIPFTWSGDRTQTAFSTSNKLIRSAAPLIHSAGLCYQL
jgi:hypothetical protein